MSDSHESSPRPRRSARRALVLFLAALVGLPIVLIGLALVFQPRDDAPPDLSRMAVKWVELPDSENAASLLDQASALQAKLAEAPFFDFLEGDPEPPTPWMLLEAAEEAEESADPADEKLLADMRRLFEELGIAEEPAGDWEVDDAWRAGFVKAQELVHDAYRARLDEVTALIKQAVARGQFVLPKFDYSLAGMDFLGKWRGLGQSCLWSARAEMRLGHPEAALDFAFLALDLAALCEQARAFLIGELVAMHMRQSALAEIDGLIAAGTYTQAQLVAAAQRLEGSATCIPCFQDALRHEFWFQMHAIDRVSTSSDPRDIEEAGVDLPRWMAGTGYGLLVNRTKAISAAYMQASIDNLERPGVSHTGPPPEPEYLPPERNLVERMVRGNMIGDAILRVVTPIFHEPLQRRLQVDAHVAATRILIALRAWKDARGSLPEKLEELVPEFLPSVPLDPYDLLPMRYSKANLEVYSAARDAPAPGTNRKARSEREREPWTFSIGF